MVVLACILGEQDALPDTGVIRAISAAIIRAMPVMLSMPHALSLNAIRPNMTRQNQIQAGVMTRVIYSRAGLKTEA